MHSRVGRRRHERRLVGVEALEPRIALTASPIDPQFLRTTAAGDATYFVTIERPFFSHDQLWKTDGTPAGTTLLRELPPRTLIGYEHIEVGGRFLFSFDDGIHGEELWRTDGTAAGTELLVDLAPGASLQSSYFYPYPPTPGSEESIRPNGSSPANFVSRGGSAYFTARVPSGPVTAEGRQNFRTGVWRTDGTAAGTQQVYLAANDEAILNLFAAGGQVFLVETRNLSPDPNTKLWALTQGPSPIRVAEIPGVIEYGTTQPAQVGSGPFVVAIGSTLWRTDGTAAGTSQFFDGVSGSAWSFTAHGPDALYFTANFPSGGEDRGTELWRTDGTAAGTFMVRDIAPGGSGTGSSFVPYTSYPHFMLSTPLGMFFVADDVVHGSELWVTDGTTAGTRLVRDLTPGQTDGIDPRGNHSTFSDLVWMGSRVYFVLNHRELWATDGTLAGTEMIRDLDGVVSGDDPGIILSSAQMTVMANGTGGQRLVFSGRDPYLRMVLWTSDGSTAGTLPLQGGRPPAPLVDFNGDRITDTLWRQSGTNAFMAFMYDAAGNLSGQRLLGMDPGYTVVGTGDFDGNGVTDLIWEESATGVQVGWLFNADGTLAGATGLVAAPWRLQSTGDFDGDGRTDLVWQHGAGGATAVWLMNGLSIAGSAGLNSDPAYELVETGADFDANGDGKSDLIWRAVASGAHTLFRMNGVGVSSTTPLGGGLTQEIAGTGDFDGDGAHDIVWRELGSGRRLLRYYADGTFTGTQAELPLGTEWSLAGTFDGDGDGRNDMLWRYDGPGASQGANILWLMEGATIRGQRSLGGDATWRLFARG